MKRVLITATVQSHIAQFHKPLAEMLHAHGFEVHVAGKDNLALKNGLSINWADKVFDVPFARSPKSVDNIRAYRQLKKIIDSGNYSHIHCNTPMGGIVTRLAARNARSCGCEIIYTAHGFHFHKQSSKSAWCIYYPIEQAFARLTNKLITINHEDYILASKHFGCATYYTHGVGVDAQRYVPVLSEDERLALCRELNIEPNKKVILSVGELLPNKNQKMIIKAMRIIRENIPDVFLILAGNGPLKEQLEQHISHFRLEDSIRMIGYSTELEKYQKVASLLAACSYREGLPLNLVEAMLAKNPVVASHNRGHDELVNDGVTGYLVEPDNYECMANHIIDLLNNEDLRLKFGENARVFALDFSFENVKRELKTVYGL